MGAAPDDEPLHEARGCGAVAATIDGGALEKFYDVRVHLADDERLDIEQLLKTIVREIGGEGTVAHTHV